MSSKLLLPEIGAETFGDISEDAQGNPLTHAQVIRNVIAQGQAAEAANLDFFGVGEHHRDDYAVSSPEIVLAALASTTKQIKLGTAVTVLSSDDPVRVYQRFATLDAISQGRTEIAAGRGSFIESFPLFGFELDDYEALYEEKLDLLARLRHGNPVVWHGKHRSALAQPAGLSPAGEPAADHLGGRRWRPAVRCSRRAPRASAVPGHHRGPALGL
ncbi:LLM class flavin-dependent oxidoreductase [Glutamicibacter halophytocola]